MYIPINYTCKKGINIPLKTFKSNLLNSSGFSLLKNASIHSMLWKMFEKKN